VQDPEVSIIMPIHGLQPFIGEALESVSNQTFRDFEMIIVSEPETGIDVLSAVENCRDTRIMHHRNHERLGLGRSLNLALGMAKGRYIARIDSDDKWAKDKLERQCHYLEEHPDIAVLGSSSYIINEAGKITGECQYTTGSTAVGWRLLYDDSINNTSSIMRRIVPQAIGGFDPQFMTAEDYDFWARASEVFKIDNLPEKLVFYRTNPHGISTIDLSGTQANSAIISKRSMERVLGSKLPPEIVRTMRFPYEKASPNSYEVAARTTIELCHNYVIKRNLAMDESEKVLRIASRAYWDLLARAAAADLADSGRVIARAILSRPPRPDLKTIRQASIAFALGLKTSSE
jgi:glycosyltransferase involved in cell wall biosynthesis